MKPVETRQVSFRQAGQEGHVQLQVGDPAPGFEPLHFQRQWLRERYGVEIAENLGDG